jgi:hypothetical protein
MIVLILILAVALIYAVLCLGTVIIQACLSGALNVPLDDIAFWPVFWMLFTILFLAGAFSVKK